MKKGHFRISYDEGTFLNFRFIVVIDGKGLLNRMNFSVVDFEQALMFLG